MQTELLAPAKDKETAIEAINCGADAIYIGAPRFGARKNVPNTIEDIKEVIDYAHKFWAKVFVTMNTILTDSELDEAVELAKNLSEIGVDALIIQDMGLLERLMELLPSLEGEGGRRPDGEIPKLSPIHMSTQCDNYLPQKVKFFNEIGVSRVILARELSIEQIKKIHKENPNLELEAFVHGALCVSMSGQCYLSQAIGGRSANRGECAQPCRKKYTVETTDGEIIKKDFYALCLKDFNASNCLEDFKKAGICSFKIEGRLKDKGYVKNIVSYYRKKLGKGCSSGRSTYHFTPNPEKSFNRGFTEYFLNGRTNCFNQESPKSRGEYLGEVIETRKNWIKVNTDKNIYPQDGIYCNGDGFLVNKIETTSPPHPHLYKVSQPKEGGVIIYPNKHLKTLKKGDKLWRNLDVEFEKELQKPVKRQIGVEISISPSSVLRPPSPTRGEGTLITLTDENRVTINHILPQGEKANNSEKMKDTFIKQFSKTGESDFYIEDIKISTELPFMPVSDINKLRRELFDQLMQKRIETYNNSIRQWQKPMKYAKYFQEEVDYRANIHNSSAEQFYKKSGVNVKEWSFESQKPSRQIALMRCKHCIKYALKICKSPKNLVLRDELGKAYPLKFDCKNCEMSVMSG